jgi:hypothetical protein
MSAALTGTFLFNNWSLSMNDNNAGSFDFSDLDLSDLKLDTIEVIPASIMSRLPENGASCCSDASSTCCSSSGG